MRLDVWSLVIGLMAMAWRPASANAPLDVAFYDRSPLHYRCDRRATA
jgi:hypothetical protein